MKLKEFIKKHYPNVYVKHNHEVSFITDYDKDVIENSIFISNGNTNYIFNAIKLGAKTIVLNKSDKKIKFKKEKGINYIYVDSNLVFQARFIKDILDSLDKKLIIVGITGTSGKTSSLHLLYECLKYESYDTLAIGTHFIKSYYGLKEEINETKNTTVSLSQIYKHLMMKNFDYDYLIMEVSSEGIISGRILGLLFDTVSFTNIASDHLNFHKTLDSYINAKEKLLYQVKNNIILNYDDNILKSFNNKVLNNVISYGIKSGDIKAKYIKYGSNTSFYIEDDKNNYLINTNLVGKFNVYNILNVWCILKSLNIDRSILIKVLNKKIVIPGRMNEIKKDNCKFIVDYAHTVNEVEAVLKYYNLLKKNNEFKLITIIGCGGDKDKTKRPIIGNIVTRFSDHVYFTEDNSRNEDTKDIINDMTKYLTKDNFTVFYNRKETIKKVYEKYQNENNEVIILVLGKGAENYMIKDSVYYPYSDIDEINSL